LRWVRVHGVPPQGLQQYDSLDAGALVVAQAQKKPPGGYRAAFNS